MKENILTVNAIKDTAVVGSAISIAVIIQNINLIVGCAIGIFTLIYVVMRAIDFYYEWRHNNWKRRKELEKELDK